MRFSLTLLYPDAGACSSSRSEAIAICGILILSRSVPVGVVLRPKTPLVDSLNRGVET